MGRVPAVGQNGGPLRPASCQGQSWTSQTLTQTCVQSPKQHRDALKNDELKRLVCQSASRPSLRPTSGLPRVVYIGGAAASTKRTVHMSISVCVVCVCACACV